MEKKIGILRNVFLTPLVINSVYLLKWMTFGGIFSKNGFLNLISKTI